MIGRGPDGENGLERVIGTAADLDSVLRRLEGRGYKALKEITGAWDFGDFTLSIDHVQGDPFAEPSRMRVRIESGVARLEPSAYATEPRRWGTAGYLARRFADRALKASKPIGTGKGGQIRMAPQGQVVLRQTALQVTPDGALEARFTVGLPAHGRRIAGRAAAELLVERVGSLLRDAVIAPHDDDAIEVAAATNEDADALRAQLSDHGLVAFVADGSALPRRSGVDDRPLEGADVVAFHAPESLAVTLHAPNAGAVPGMGVREGVTLIVGGGFHGKSTLLRAVQAGIHNHPPGDGRERVVTRRDAVKVRAEDGRSVVAVDISGFIDGLPYGRDTTEFTTENASGSTSQAAAIVEALEVGATLLLIDEDTSATNFMIRDRRMQELVPGAEEPITPFVDRVRQLSDEHGVSAVIVIGGSGDYLDVADAVIRMNEYRAIDATAAATETAARLPTGRIVEADGGFSRPPPRRIDPSSIQPRRGKRASYVRVPDDRTLQLGREVIDLVAVEQLELRAQTRAIGLALARLASRDLQADIPLAEALDALEHAIFDGGLDILDERRSGDLAEFRRYELAAALNRLRGVRVAPTT